MIEEGISKLPCWPLVTVGAMCCVHAFRDGLLARIADTRETLSWLHLYQVASLDCCVSAQSLMVLEKVLSISSESKYRIKEICGKLNGPSDQKSVGPVELFQQPSVCPCLEDLGVEEQPLLCLRL